MFAMRPIASPSTIITFCGERNCAGNERLFSPLPTNPGERGERKGDNRVRILLTNDDGIHAPGLRALRVELLKLGEVVVVAPATEQSAVGHSITLSTPLIVQQVFDDDRQFIGWAVEGRPADCVKLALLELLPEPADLIVSGLNAGINA